METRPGDETGSAEERQDTWGDDRPSDAPKNEEEEVDKASEDSFPASDPPSY